MGTLLTRRKGFHGWEPYACCVVILAMFNVSWWVLCVTWVSQSLWTCTNMLLGLQTSYLRVWQMQPTNTIFNQSFILENITLQLMSRSTKFGTITMDRRTQVNSLKKTLMTETPCHWSCSKEGRRMYTYTVSKLDCFDCKYIILQIYCPDPGRDIFVNEDWISPSGEVSPPTWHFLGTCTWSNDNVHCLFASPWPVWSTTFIYVSSAAFNTKKKSASAPFLANITKWSSLLMMMQVSPTFRTQILNDIPINWPCLNAARLTASTLMDLVLTSVEIQCRINEGNTDSEVLPETYSSYNMLLSSVYLHVPLLMSDCSTPLGLTLEFTGPGSGLQQVLMIGVTMWVAAVIPSKSPIMLQSKGWTSPITSFPSRKVWMRWRADYANLNCFNSNPASVTVAFNKWALLGFTLCKKMSFTAGAHFKNVHDSPCLLSNRWQHIVCHHSLHQKCYLFFTFMPYHEHQIVRPFFQLETLTDLSINFIFWKLVLFQWLWL